MAMSLQNLSLWLKHTTSYSAFAMSLTERDTKGSKLLSFHLFFLLRLLDFYIQLCSMEKCSQIFSLLSQQLQCWTFVKEISVVGVIAQYCLCDMGGRQTMWWACFLCNVACLSVLCISSMCVCIGCCNAFMLFVCRFGSLWGIRFLYFFFIFRLNSHLQRVCSYLYNRNSIPNTSLNPSLLLHCMFSSIPHLVSCYYPSWISEHYHLPTSLCTPNIKQDTSYWLVTKHHWTVILNKKASKESVPVHC